MGYRISIFFAQKSLCILYILHFLHPNLQLFDELDEVTMKWMKGSLTYICQHISVGSEITRLGSENPIIYCWYPGPIGNSTTIWGPPLLLGARPIKSLKRPKATKTTTSMKCLSRKNLLKSRGKHVYVFFFFPCELTRMKEVFFFCFWDLLKSIIAVWWCSLTWFVDESWNLHYLPSLDQAIDERISGLCCVLISTIKLLPTLFDHQISQILSNVVVKENPCVSGLF